MAIKESPWQYEAIHDGVSGQMQEPLFQMWPLMESQRQRQINRFAVGSTAAGDIYISRGPCRIVVEGHLDGLGVPAFENGGVRIRTEQPVCSMPTGAGRLRLEHLFKSLIVMCGQKTENAISEAVNPQAIAVGLILSDGSWRRGRPRRRRSGAGAENGE